MAYIQLIYNPVAGQRVFPMHLDRFVEVFQNKGYDVHIRRTKSAQDFGDFLIDRDMTGCEALVVAGGDGSLNQVVNAMQKQGIDIPLGVIPAGTANDFAVHIGMPLNQLEAIERIAEMKIGHVDLGKVNDAYFINVCCGGLFSNISQNIDIEMKNTLGKMAYYIKGVQQLPNFTKLKLKIVTEEETIVEDYYLFLLLNGSSAGGFNRLGFDADISDGKMDFVGIKACHVTEIPQLFGKILMGEHLTDKNVRFFQSSKILIECIEGVEGFEASDIDGEEGPKFPLDIQVLNRQLTIIKP